MNEYELLYVISPRLSAEDVDAMVERVGALIESVGGSVSMVEPWGRRRLAYPVRHHFEGSYVLTYLTMPGERAAEFERALNINEDILRHLLIAGVIPGYEGPPEQEVDLRRATGGRPAFDRPPEPRPDGDAPSDGDAAAGDAPAESGEAAEPAPAEAPASAEAAEPKAAARPRRSSPRPNPPRPPPRLRPPSPSDARRGPRPAIAATALQYGNKAITPRRMGRATWLTSTRR